jgi:hypothetical protein
MTKVAVILTPGEAADRLGTTVPNLVALIRRGKYRFTELRPGGKPGDKGHHRWGLSLAQVEAIVRGQERGLAELPIAEPEGPGPLSPVSPDGKSRLRRGRGAK